MMPASVAGIDWVASSGGSAATISTKSDMDCEAISFSRHALQRMFERAISPDEVHTALADGEVIADYPDDTPYHSMLILAFVGKRPLHVVVARDDSARHCYVITAYVADQTLWKSDFRTRKPT
jgi:hypothetical protein